MTSRTFARITMAVVAVIAFSGGFVAGISFNESATAAKQEARERALASTESTPTPTTVHTPEPAAPTPPPTTDWDQLCPVVYIVDGDTADVTWMWHGESKERLRFLNIDTPERGEPGFDEATAALATLIRDSPVRLEFEKPGVPARGGYGRLLVYVFNADGLHVNLEMIRQGWAIYYVKYGRGEYAEEMEAAEAEAKATGVGIWAESE